MPEIQKFFKCYFPSILYEMFGQCENSATYWFSLLTSAEIQKNYKEAAVRTMLDFK